MTDQTEGLRGLYKPATERALRKQLDRLDPHATRFVGLSPFVVIASSDRDGRMDASPRGGESGFVKVLGDTTLLIPDAPGNNRLDTLTNLSDRGRIGLLFLVPGVDETLRVNGSAKLVSDPALIARCASAARAPKLVIEVTVEEVYLHCAKALMRSRLWSGESRVDRSVLPTMGQMLKDQIGLEGPAESQEEMLARYRADL